MNESMLVAKFVVSSVTRQVGNDGATAQESVQLNAVYDNGTGPNAEWSKATPWGELKMTISNPAAFGRLLPGQKVLLHFVPELDAAR